MAATPVRFTEDQADKILRLQMAGVTEEELARRYGVTEAAIKEALKEATATRDHKRRERDRRLNA